MARSLGEKRPVTAQGVEGGPDRWGRLVSLTGGHHLSVGGGKIKGVPVRVRKWAAADFCFWAEMAPRALFYFFVFFLLFYFCFLISFLDFAY
jgi:hypothetical protein